MIQDMSTQQLLVRARARHAAQQTAPTLEPLDFTARSANELRPDSFRAMIGQQRLRALLSRVVDNAKISARALDHILLVGSAGTGKTTFAQIIAHELDRPVYMLKAPVAYDVFQELAKVAEPLSVVVIDEIHQQVSGDRRGITQAADPETFYHVLEDKRLMTPTGALPFPDLTFIGATTDAGLLPEPFLARFPLQPQLDPYTVEEMVELAYRNGRTLDMILAAPAAWLFATASRKTPRVVNRYIRNARALSLEGAHGQVRFTEIDYPLALEIVEELNSTTPDGLTQDMQNMLRFLLKSRRETRDGTVTYQAGIGSIATACGKSRDQKSVALYVEPYLIERGLIGITHGGRALTDDGIERAREL